MIPIYIIEPISPFGRKKTRDQEIRERQDQEELLARLFYESTHQKEPDTSQATPSVGGIPYPSTFAINMPSGFSFPISFSIMYSPAANTYTPTIKAQDFELIPDKEVFIHPTGSDANSGLAWSSPVYSLTRAITVLTAQSPVVGRINMKNGQYFYTGSATINSYPCSIKSNGGIAEIVCGNVGTSWTLSSGSMYVLNGFVPDSIYDLKYRDIYGSPLNLASASSTNSCFSTPGTHVVFNSNSYVNLSDRRAPDSQVFGVNTAAGSVFNIRTSSYMEGIRIIGRNNLIRIQQTRAGDVTSFYNCEYIPSLSSSAPVFEVTINDGVVISEKCACYWGGNDGFNYHYYNSLTSSAFIEINCTATKNGSSGGGINNGSTGHDGFRGVRINGTYVQNENRNVHDVSNNTQTWNVNCLAGNSLVNGPESNIGFACGTSTNATKMWLDNCRSIGTLTTGSKVYSNAIIYVRNMNSTETRSTVGTGNYIDY